TYMIDGIMQHQDSHGGGGVITDGAAQWMTAGAGILHIETPPEELVVKGGLFHGLQLWVNLPAAQKWVEPRYQGLEPGDAALLSSPDGGALVRVIAGDVAGHAGPGLTRTPMSFVHATVSPGAELDLPWRADFNGLVYVMRGSGSVGAEARPVAAGQLAVFGPGDHLRIRAAGRQDSTTEGLEAIVLGGRPIREPVAWYGPFVMNTKEELAEAMADYRAGKLGVIPANALMPHVVR
ncbi:MAG TPA: pirin-like C-terminal cupin domain-containing protein, partial [Acidimicrobiales bacterium]